jgi:hypothetical protein
MTKKLLLIIFLYTSNLIFSQEEVQFSIRFQDYIQGDVTFIANNIVNRNDRKNANEPYNKTTNVSKLNDEYEMSYIDIDNDKTTYSSSSALYNPKKKSNEIIFAGLYWTATYKYPIGFNDNEVYTGDGQRESNIDEIKIKTPAAENYQNIKGQVIFDGYQTKNHKNNAPYVCFYDLTNMIRETPNGEYTVANIKSTQGSIEGGVAAGWIIYFVYNDKESSKKYVTLYDGFAYVFNKPIAIKLTNFLTPKIGDIKSKITLAALEGDLKIEGDNVRLKNVQTSKFFPLFTKSRNENNLFNSQISFEDVPFIDRIPASLNTLGFDALLISLDNKKNKIINNNTTETELKIASAGDKVYLFSAGFTVDVDEEFFEKNKKQTTIEKPEEAIVLDEVVNKPLETKNTDLKKKTKKEKNKVPKITLQNPTATTESDKSEVYESHGKQKFSKEAFKHQDIVRQTKDIRKLKIQDSSLNSGYYLIANVFEFPKNAEKYTKFLKKNNINSNSFLNPENNYSYVYLKFYSSLKKVQEAYDSNLNDTFFDDYWILEVGK